MASLPPPDYEKIATHQEDRVHEHYLTCPEAENEEVNVPCWKHCVSTLALRGWAKNNRSATVAVGPWWIRLWYDTWKVSEPAPRKSSSEKLTQWLRRLRKPLSEQEVVSMLAVNGTPLKPGDIEYTIVDPDNETSPGRYDWTDRWGWRIDLTVYTYAEHVLCSNWSVRCEVFLQDLPSQLRAGGVSWRNAIVDHPKVEYKRDRYSERQWNWRCSSVFSPASRSPQRWQAGVVARFADQLSIQDVRHCLSAESVYKARICQRTGPGRYKIVMMYYLSTVYGNDLSGHRVDTWHPRHAENFAQFIRPLLPYGPHANHQT